VSSTTCRRADDPCSRSAGYTTQFDQFETIHIAGEEIGSVESEKPNSLGQSILSLLRTASDRLASETQQSLGAAHTLSQELQVAKDRIEKLEADVQRYRETAERAQALLGKIASEVEDRLLKESEGKQRLQ
jgi:hypothetical protein